MIIFIGILEGVCKQKYIEFELSCGYNFKVWENIKQYMFS